MMTGWLVADDRAGLVDRAARLAEWNGDEADGEAFLAGVHPAWVVGTADEAARQLDELREAGLERVMAQHLLHEDVDALALVGRLADPRPAL
jgi:alkanesulfonate monooxygenase SsuD/methylene tetrahydromethanopterin reductase-like flavin-dependent oxidoreductase (luciferase family)